MGIPTLMNRLHFIHPAFLKETKPGSKNASVARRHTDRLACWYCDFAARKFFGLERHLRLRHPDQEQTSKAQGSAAPHADNYNSRSGRRRGRRRPHGRRGSGSSDSEDDSEEVGGGLDDEDDFVREIEANLPPVKRRSASTTFATPPRKRGRPRSVTSSSSCCIAVDMADAEAMAKLPEFQPALCLEDYRKELYGNDHVPSDSAEEVETKMEEIEDKVEKVHIEEEDNDALQEEEDKDSPSPEEDGSVAADNDVEMIFNSLNGSRDEGCRDQARKQEVQDPEVEIPDPAFVCKFVREEEEDVKFDPWSMPMESFPRGALGAKPEPELIELDDSSGDDDGDENAVAGESPRPPVRSSSSAGVAAAGPSGEIQPVVHLLSSDDEDEARENGRRTKKKKKTTTGKVVSRQRDLAVEEGCLS